MTLTGHLRASLALAVLVFATALPRVAQAVHDGWDDDGDGRGIGVQVWSDRGDRAVYQDGDPLALYVRLSQSAYVAVYDIDTRGRVHLLYPRAPLEERLLAGGRTYRFPRSGRDDFFVDGPSGIEYVQVIASPEPLYVRLPWDRDRIDDDSDWQSDRWMDDSDRGDDWVYAVSGDPFVWCSRVNSLILGDDPYCGTGYTSFYVDRRVAYPRYLCNECHVHPIYGSAAVWDPYAYSCPVFEVRVSAGWVYRAAPYRRTCPPLFVYYRRDNCPPRWSSLPRWWSSTDRHRIREYFGAALAQPRALPMTGRTAVEKDNDYRQRSGGGAQWYAPRRAPARAPAPAPQAAPSQTGRDGWRSNRGGASKDADMRSRARSYRDVDPPPGRGNDPSWSGPPPEQRGSDRRSDGRGQSNRSWITDLLRGTGPAARGEARQAPPPPEDRGAPQNREQGDRGNGNGNGRGNGNGNGHSKDGDHRSR